MTFVCPHCGYQDLPILKPLYWKLYGSYADFNDFSNEYPIMAKQLCEYGKTGDNYFEYELHGKTRKVVHRFPKAFRMMRDRKLYEKTPSETKKEELKKIG